MSSSKNPLDEIAAIVATVTGTDGDYPTAIDNLFMSRRSSPTQPLYAAQWPCFALVLQGAKSLKLGSKVHDYGVGDCLVVSIDLPVVSRVTKASRAVPHLGLGMAISADRLKDLIGRAGLPVPAAHVDNDLGVAVEKASTELLDAVHRLLRLLERPHEIPALAPLIEQEILYRLLTGPFGARLMRIAISETPSNRIAKAIGWIRENYIRPMRIEELASHSGMSSSSLHHHFKAVTAMTPLQYQKQLRLREARRLMLAERLDAASAGFSVGYYSASQFSREYSRLFGYSPARDISSAVTK